MPDAVLRGDWLQVRRHGDRVRIRVRPRELVWRTTAEFTVDEVRAIAIEPVRPKLVRARRGILGPARSRVVKPAVTQLTITYSTTGNASSNANADSNAGTSNGTSDGTTQEVSVRLHETEWAVAEVFVDLADRRVGPPAEVRDELGAEEWESPIDADHEQSGPEPVRRPRVDPVLGERSDRDVERDLRTLCAGDHDLAPELAREVVFKLDLGESPGDVQQWLLEQVAVDIDLTDVPESPNLEVLFPHEEHATGADQGVWVKKKRRRAPRLVGRRGSP